MSLKSFSAKIFANLVRRRIDSWASRPLKTQEKVFQNLIGKAKQTTFGKDHGFESIRTYDDFARAVPIRDYEQLRPYVERVVGGEKDVLWPGKPLYFAKTSGTTSGVKYIPISKESMPTHIHAARNAILCYIQDTGRSSFVDGKMIFLQGSPEMEEKNGVKLGRLSGIAAHYVPGYLQRNRMPSWKTNCIEDWETKVDAIVEETVREDMTVISGIPSWVQMYFSRLEARTGKKVGQIFPNFSLFIYGGVNFEPYRSKFESMIGRKVDSIELFPASEGFFAFQDRQKEKGMLLQLNSGIFYEFIKAEEFYKESPRRYTLGEVEQGINYVMIISTTAGLWAYDLGDIIQFTSLRPYRVIVSGRNKHFISAFGEHVIAKEVEEAMRLAIQETAVEISEFTVAPQTDPPPGELPFHEWFVEFQKEPENINTFAEVLDKAMQDQNSYYRDLIEGKILQRLKITLIRSNGFQHYMRSIGKLGGQNKVPRLSNDRKIADRMEQQKK